MDLNDIRTLRILEQVQTGGQPSQRDLARELNISLGLVNSFIKRLARKGYVKIKTIPKNRIRYILTRQGAAEKTRLTYAYIQYSYKFYREARQKLRELFIELEKQGEKNLVFYGAGDLAEIAYVSLQETSIKLLAVIDDLKIGESFLGLTVSDPARLDSLSFSKVLITAIDSRDIILRKMAEKGISNSRIVMLE
ncbi:MAG: winged helix-turn-helix transcriptional regulator [Desulfobacterales bacterium]|nr:MAG: winged helix-turn-helix transcriptional regulator [Desulfobacterales bacterium]